MKKLKFVAAAAAALALSGALLAGCSSSSSSSSASASASSESASASASAESASAESASAESASAEAASASAAAASVEAAPAEGKTLIVGFDAEYPPYGFLDANGEPTGFDIDLAKATAEANDWGFEAKPIDWDSKDLELDSGNITCIWNGFTLEGREDLYAFSEPYMLNEQVIVVAADSGIESLADLAGKTVVTQAGSAALDVLEDEEGQAALASTFASLNSIPDYNNAFLQLESGQVDAVACDLSIAQFQISQRGDAYVQLDESLSSEHYAVGFKLGDDETAQAVTDTLKALYADGTVQQLCDKYAEYGLSFDNWVLE